MAKTKFLEILLINILLLIAAAATLDGNLRVGRQQIQHRGEELSEEKFITISRLSDAQHLRTCVKNIVTPRVVGTPGHKRVREYIVNSLKDLEWNVDVHKFHEKTPILGKLHFHNIIAKLNPDAERFLVLACHYDSKYMADFEFHGATDSAVPCAIMLNLAQVLREQLKKLRNTNVSLMLIFFDGEEAFKEWGPHDSIYGARNLAKKWDEEGFLDRIDMMMLLDLIGAPDPKFYSFFKNTEPWYSRLLTIEERLSNANLLERYASNGVSQYYPDRYFQPNSIRASQVEDDHIPFLRRNVPILHLIPVPFPDCWHTSDDNESAIDYATTENIARIVRVFTMEYLLGLSSVKK